MDHHDRMNAKAEESPSHLGHEMSPTSATPMSMEHDHRGMMEQDLRRRFFVVLVLTIPVLALSPTIQSWAGYRLPASRPRASSWPRWLRSSPSTAACRSSTAQGRPFERAPPT